MQEDMGSLYLGNRKLQKSKSVAMGRSGTGEKEDGRR